MSNFWEHLRRGENGFFFFDNPIKPYKPALDSSKLHMPGEIYR